MFTKRISCIVLGLAISAILFAQNSSSDLEKISLDFSERLIRDGASLERLEKFSQNQTEESGSYSAKNRKLDETLQRISQNLSESGKKHLEEYREFGEILNEKSKIKENQELIKEKAEQFSPDEREELYVANMVKNKKFFFNYFPGYGVGSFAQGDVAGGLMQVAGSGLGAIGWMCIFFYNSDEDNYDDNSNLLVIGPTAIIIGFASNFIFGTIRPIIFKRSRNAMLRSSLGLDSEGKAIAQSTKEHEIQLSFAPIVNPVASQYGAVAMIRF